jgi:hypothetical protein
MKWVVAFLVLAWGIALHAAAAMEPLIVLVTSDETRVYRVNDGKIELKERYVKGGDFSDSLQVQALDDLPDSKRLVAAYLTNFLDCGQRVTAATPLREWIQQESNATDGRWLRRLETIPVNDSYILISAQGGARAVVINRKTGQRLPGSPCGAAVKFARLSPLKQRVAFVFEGLKTVEFYGGKGRLSWSSRRTGTRFVQIHRLQATVSSVNVATIAEDPLDLMLPDEENWWLLVAKYSSEWWKPTNWLYAVGGHGTKRSDISLLTYSSSGLLSSRDIASGVVLVEGRLIAESR